MTFPMGFSYEILAARLGLKDAVGELNVNEAKRTWQLWGLTQDYKFADDNGSADQNMEIAFAKESGLPTKTVRQRIKVCKEFQELIDQASA